MCLSRMIGKHGEDISDIDVDLHAIEFFTAL
ncbi:hypothetical protein J2Z84_000891 [Agrobacterium rubi]|nr:hypothetical protein [Agrobacterium rubi]